MRNAAPVGVRACVFDAYATLFDYASAAERCRDALGEKLTPLTTLWREKQLQHSKVYQLGVDPLGIEPAAISFQSSNAWDAYAASAFGLRVVWCNRYHQRPERLPGKPQHEVRSLAELSALLGVPSGG